VNDPAQLPLRWHVREPPLEAVAAAATGPTARALVRRLLALAPERLASLRGVAGRDVVLVVGEESALPWVDGVQYLGRDPGAPALLLPTTLRPAVPLALVERAVMLRRKTAPAPAALLLDPPLLVTLDDARTVDRPALEQWLREQDGGDG
jgi:hypothetical protein